MVDRRALGVGHVIVQALGVRHETPGKHLYHHPVEILPGWWNMASLGPQQNQPSPVETMNAAGEPWRVLPTSESRRSWVPLGQTWDMGRF